MNLTGWFGMGEIMKYRVKLSFYSEEYIVDAKNEDDAENKATEKYAGEEHEPEIEVFLMESISVKYVRIDSWNRPVFKEINGENYYGSLDILFSYNGSKDNVMQKVGAEDLTYFGKQFDCEPMGTTPIRDIKIIWSV